MISLRVLSQVGKKGFFEYIGLMEVNNVCHNGNVLKQALQDWFNSKFPTAAASH
jgi:hypothetical protein